MVSQLKGKVKSIARFLEFQVCAVVLLRPAPDPVPYCHCQYHHTHPDPPVPASSWSQPSLRGPGQPPPRHPGRPRPSRWPPPTCPALAVTRRRTVWHWSMRRTRSPAASDLAGQPEAHWRPGLRVTGSDGAASLPVTRSPGRWRELGGSAQQGPADSDGRRRRTRTGGGLRFTCRL